MDAVKNGKRGSKSLVDQVSTKVREFLDSVFDADSGFLGHIDPWTQRRIMKGNLGKVALVMADAEPEEACFRDLVREIDTEARSGMFLAGRQGEMDHLRLVVAEPGVSGELYREMDRIAPIYFADAVARSTKGSDMVPVAIRAGHDRAYVDASVSEITISFLVRDSQRVLDMLAGMRAMQYTFHEDVLRNRIEMPLLLSKVARDDLRTMVGELALRSGDHDERIAEIGRRAEAIQRLPTI